MENLSFYSFKIVLFIFRTAETTKMLKNVNTQN